MPGARSSQREAGEGVERISHRIRAEPRSRAASSLTRYNGTPCRSETSERRRDAVKFKARGLPAISPITQARSRQRNPSSSAKSMSSGLVASTWITRFRHGSGRPGPYGLPDRRKAALSCTQRTARGSSSANPAVRNPSRARAKAAAVPPPSIAEANISLWQELPPKRQGAPIESTWGMVESGGSGKFMPSFRFICSYYVPSLEGWQGAPAPRLQPGVQSILQRGQRIREGVQWNTLFLQRRRAALNRRPFPS